MLPSPLSVLLFCFLLSGTSNGQDLGPAFKGDGRERTRVRPENNWDHGHQWTRVTVDNHRVGSVLSHALKHNFTLPRVQLQRGVTYMGAATRLRRVVRDLLSGRSVKIGVVGGSVSWGQGASSRGITDWFSVFSNYVVTAFPNANVTTRNGCTPGVPSSYMILCLELSVDTDVDLVLTEYTLNDGHDSALYGNKVVKGMERLLRRILALPKQPAVIMVHHMAHYQAMYPAGHPKHGGGWRPFHETSEDAQGALSQYYDIQSLSQRSSLYRLAAWKEQPGYLWENLFADFHAGDMGHKCIADQVVHLVQTVALDLMLHPYGPEDDTIIAEGMPVRPMYEGNLPPNATMCLMADLFRELIVNVTGFEYLNEGTPEKPKYGWVASQPGSSMRLRVDTDRSAIATGAVEPVHVFFHHLRTYERMGSAEFSCVSGCSCEPVIVDAHITERISQLYMAEMAVTQAKSCEIQIKVLDRTSSGQHKFKISGIILAERPGEATGLRGVSGHNEAFGLWVHTGEQKQVVISKAGRKGDWGS